MVFIDDVLEISEKAATKIKRNKKMTLVVWLGLLKFIREIEKHFYKP